VTSYQKRSSARIWLRGVRCSGYESDIKQCFLWCNTGQNITQCSLVYSGSCINNRVVSVSCKTSMPYVTVLILILINHGRRRHGQGGHLPLEMLKCFFAEMLSKSSVDEVFMHHFEKMSSAFGALPPDPHRGAAPRPCSGTFVLQTPSLPTPGKNPAGAHDTNYTGTDSNSNNKANTV